MRTIVFSDVHGEPDIIAAVLEHSGFDPHADRLIFAGDAVDIGRDPEGCLSLLEEIHAECLVGNHEYSALVDFKIDDVRLGPTALRSIERCISSGRWQLAAEAEGVLITHAGVSAEFLGQDGAGTVADVARFAGELNAQFRLAVAQGEYCDADVIEMGGPLWWRPSRGQWPVPGMKQVVGHTPREVAGGSRAVGRLAAGGVYLIDPNVRAWRGRGFGLPVPVRYAVNEAGHGRVVDASQ